MVVRWTERKQRRELHRRARPGHEGSVRDGLDVRALVRQHGGCGDPTAFYPRGLASMLKGQSRVGEYQPDGGPPLGARMALSCQT